MRAGKTNHCIDYNSSGWCERLRHEEQCDYELVAHARAEIIDVSKIAPHAILRMHTPSLISNTLGSNIAMHVDKVGRNIFNMLTSLKIAATQL